MVASQRFYCMMGQNSDLVSLVGIKVRNTCFNAVIEREKSIITWPESAASASVRSAIMQFGGTTCLMIKAVYLSTTTRFRQTI